MSAFSQTMHEGVKSHSQTHFWGLLLCCIEYRKFSNLLTNKAPHDGVKCVVQPMARLFFSSHKTGAVFFAGMLLCWYFFLAIDKRDFSIYSVNNWAFWPVLAKHQSPQRPYTTKITKPLGTIFFFLSPRKGNFQLTCFSMLTSSITTHFKSAFKYMFLVPKLVNCQFVPPPFLRQLTVEGHFSQSDHQGQWDGVSWGQQETTEIDSCWHLNPIEWRIRQNKNCCDAVLRSRYRREVHFAGQGRVWHGKSEHVLVVLRVIYPWRLMMSGPEDPVFGPLTFRGFKPFTLVICFDLLYYRPSKYSRPTASLWVPNLLYH